MGTLNLCIVTHGLTLRLFLMRWLQYSVDEFEVRTAQGHTKQLVTLTRSLPCTHAYKAFAFLNLVSALSYPAPSLPGFAQPAQRLRGGPRAPHQRRHGPPVVRAQRRRPATPQPPVVLRPTKVSLVRRLGVLYDGHGLLPPKKSRRYSALKEIEPAHAFTALAFVTFVCALKSLL
jgi:hypothetical protein